MKLRNKARVALHRTQALDKLARCDDRSMHALTTRYKLLPVSPLRLLPPDPIMVGLPRPGKNVPTCDFVQRGQSYTISFFNIQLDVLIYLEHN